MIPSTSTQADVAHHGSSAWTMGEAGTIVSRCGIAVRDRDEAMVSIRELFSKPRRERPSIRRIRRIAGHISARSYLEIGVCQGLTFHRLSFGRKVAVDPDFQF